MRPRQWAKNAFVLAGLVFSGEFVIFDKVVAAFIVSVAFCLVSGAIYLVNDVVDAQVDRLNPRTAKRPIARGVLLPNTALIFSIASATTAFLLVLLVNWQSLVVLVSFAVLQLLYSLLLKQILFLDVMSIAAGFVLRALAGLFAIEVVISEWLLLSTAFLALFIALAKRRGEAVALSGSQYPQRPVLKLYSLGLIDELIAVVTPAILVVYSLYAVLGARTEWMLLTVPFVLYGTFRMLFLIHHRTLLVEDPTLAVLKDKPLLIDILLWGIAAGLISFLST